MAEENLGDYYSMSTLSPIADYGKSLQKRKAVERALKNRNPINLGSGVMYDPSSRESSISKEYQEQLAAKRQHEMAMANQKLERANAKMLEKRGYDEGRDKIKREQTVADRDYKAQQKLKPSAKTASDMSVMQNVINDAGNMVKTLDENPESIEQFWDIPANVARFAGHDTVGNLIESYTKTPEELSVKQRMNSFVAELRKRLSGSALTVMEASLGSGYLPNASGITQAEAKERYLNIIRYLEGELNVNKERFGMEQSDVTQGETGGLNPQRAAPNVPNTPAPQETPAALPSNIQDRIAELKAKMNG